MWKAIWGGGCPCFLLPSSCWDCLWNKKEHREQRDAPSVQVAHHGVRSKRDGYGWRHVQHTAQTETATTQLTPIPGGGHKYVSEQMGSVSQLLFPSLSQGFGGRSTCSMHLQCSLSQSLGWLLGMSKLQQALWSAASFSFQCCYFSPGCLYSGTLYICLRCDEQMFQQQRTYISLH